MPHKNETSAAPIIHKKSPGIKGIIPLFPAGDKTVLARRTLDALFPGHAGLLARDNLLTYCDVLPDGRAVVLIIFGYRIHSITPHSYYIQKADKYHQKNKVDLF